MSMSSRSVSVLCGTFPKDFITFRTRWGEDESSGNSVNSFSPRGPLQMFESDVCPVCGCKILIRRTSIFPR